MGNSVVSTVTAYFSVVCERERENHFFPLQLFLSLLHLIEQVSDRSPELKPRAQHSLTSHSLHHCSFYRFLPLLSGCAKKKHCSPSCLIFSVYKRQKTVGLKALLVYKRQTGLREPVVPSVPTGLHSKFSIGSKTVSSPHSSASTEALTHCLCLLIRATDSSSAQKNPSL